MICMVDALVMVQVVLFFDVHDWFSDILVILKHGLWFMWHRDLGIGDGCDLL